MILQSSLTKTHHSTPSRANFLLTAWSSVVPFFLQVSNISLRQHLNTLSSSPNLCIISAEPILPVLSSLLLRYIATMAISPGLYWHILYSIKHSWSMNEQYVCTSIVSSNRRILCSIWLKLELNVRLKFNFSRILPYIYNRSGVLQALSHTSTNRLMSGTQIYQYFEAISRLVMPTSCSFERGIDYSFRQRSTRLTAMNRVYGHSLNFQWTSTSQLTNMPRMLLSISVWYCMQSRIPTERFSQCWMYCVMEVSQTRASLGNYLGWGFSGSSWRLSNIRRLAFLSRWVQGGDTSFCFLAGRARLPLEMQLARLEPKVRRESQRDSRVIGCPRFYISMGSGTMVLAGASSLREDCRRGCLRVQISTVAIR